MGSKTPVIEHVDALELPQLTVLIGANGLGKSNFIRFFEMLSRSLRGKDLQSFLLNHGGVMTSFTMAPG